MNSYPLFTQFYARKLFKSMNKIIYKSLSLIAQLTIPQSY